MSIWEIAVLGIGLSMDAFAVSICKGMAMRKLRLSHGLIIAGAFGFFQALMPLLGWLLGSGFAGLIEAFDHWIAFGLLGIIGSKMIIDAIKELHDSDKEENYSLKPGELVLLSIATSIDALAVGLTFAFLNMMFLSSGNNPGVLPAVLIIGVITFIICFAGVYIGCKFGGKFKAWAQIAGGIILILLGIKILLEHLGIL